MDSLSRIARASEQPFQRHDFPDDVLLLPPADGVDDERGLIRGELDGLWQIGRYEKEAEPKVNVPVLVRQDVAMREGSDASKNPSAETCNGGDEEPFSILRVVDDRPRAVDVRRRGAQMSVLVHHCARGEHEHGAHTHVSGGALAHGAERDGADRTGS